MAAGALDFVTYRDDGSSLAGGYARSGALPLMDSLQAFQCRIIVAAAFFTGIPNYRGAVHAFANTASGPLGILTINEANGGTDYQHRIMQPNGSSGYYGLTNFAKTIVSGATHVAIVWGCTGSSVWVKMYEIGNTTVLLDYSAAPWATPPSQTNNWFSMNERLTYSTNVRANGPYEAIEVWDPSHTLSDAEASSFTTDMTSNSNCWYAWDMSPVTGSDPGTVTAHKGGVDLTVYETVTTDWTNPAGSYEYAAAAPAASSGVGGGAMASRNQWKGAFARRRQSL